MMLKQPDIQLKKKKKKEKKKKNLDPDLISFTKINFKWIIDLNIKFNIIKLWVDNTGENPDKLEYGEVFLYTTPMTQFMKEIINKFEFIKIKNP